MSHFNHFDLIAPYYDRLIKPPDPARLSGLASLPVRGNLLDAGGGTGRISLSLAGAVTGIVVADSSIGMIKQAKNKDGLRATCSITEQLPFKNDSFDRVIMVDALHHVRDYRQTVDELWRVVKPGGRIVIEEPDIRTWPAKFMAIMEKLLLMRSHFIAPQTISAAFRKLGAAIHTESEGSTAWVIADKRPVSVGINILGSNRFTWRSADPGQHFP